VQHLRLIKSDLLESNFGCKLLGSFAKVSVSRLKALARGHRAQQRVPFRLRNVVDVSQREPVWMDTRDASAPGVMQGLQP
jgi:hypothetical protein